MRRTARPRPTWPPRTTWRGDPEMKSFAEDEAKTARAQMDRLEAELQKPAAAARPERRAQHLPRDPRRHRRRRVGALRRRPVPHVHALRRAARLAGRDDVPKPVRARRLQGSDRAHRRATAPTRSSSSSPAATACSACPRPRRRAASTPRRHRRGAARGRRGRPTSSSTRPSCASTPTAPPAPAASTSTRPTRRCASRTCPTGIVVECQDERSQHKNRAQALALLAARIKDKQDARAAGEGGGDAEDRSIGSRRPLRAHPHLQLPAGPRHRPPHQPRRSTRSTAIMDGDLDEIVDALAAEHQAELLAALGESAAA